MITIEDEGKLLMRKSVLYGTEWWRSLLWDCSETALEKCGKGRHHSMGGTRNTRGPSPNCSFTIKINVYKLVIRYKRNLRKKCILLDLKMHELSGGVKVGENEGENSDDYLSRNIYERNQLWYRLKSVINTLQIHGRNINLTLRVEYLWVTKIKRLLPLTLKYR